MTFQAPPGFKAALDRAAKRARMNRSEFVREAIAFAVRNDCIPRRRPLLTLPESDA